VSANTGAPAPRPPTAPLAPTISSTVNNASTAYQKIITSCNQCHDVSISANGVLVKDGETKTKAEILQAFTHVRQMNQNIPVAQKAALINLVNQWIK
jgi:cytochrome c553